MTTNKEIILWNLLFALLYLLSSLFIFLISGDPPETLFSVLIIGLLFNCTLTVLLLWRRAKAENPIFQLNKKSGGEKKHEEGSIDEGVADIEPADSNDFAGDVY